MIKPLNTSTPDLVSEFSVELEAQLELLECVGLLVVAEQFMSVARFTEQICDA